MDNPLGSFAGRFDEKVSNGFLQEEGKAVGEGGKVAINVGLGVARIYTVDCGVAILVRQQLLSQ